VDGDAPRSGLPDAQVEAADEVPRLDLRPVAGGENQPCVGSAPSVGTALGLLLLVAEPERG